MNQMTDSSRRAFLAAIAASGVGAAAFPSLAHAATPDSGVGIDGSSSTSGTTAPARTEAFPAATPGTYYTYLQGDEFFPLNSSYAFAKDNLYVQATAGAIFYASLAGLPPGAQITEVTFAVIKSGGLPGAGSYFAYVATSGSFVLLNSQNNTLLPQQVDEQYVSLVVDGSAGWVIDNEQASTIQLVLNLTNSRVNSVRVGWRLGRPRAFIPIDPKRVYDSRYIAPLGPLATTTNRVVSVANSYLPDTATLDITNLVPVGAKAISYNLTIANTVGSGFLSVAPGDAAALGASSINWFQSGMVLANGLIVKLDSNRQIKVFAGGPGSTDFIIDILGYFT